MISSLSDFVSAQCLVRHVSDNAGFVPNRLSSATEEPVCANAKSHSCKHLPVRALHRQLRMLASIVRKIVRKMVEPRDPTIIEKSRLLSSENDRAFGGRYAARTLNGHGEFVDARDVLGQLHFQYAVA